MNFCSRYAISFSTTSQLFVMKTFPHNFSPHSRFLAKPLKNSIGVTLLYTFKFFSTCNPPSVPAPTSLSKWIEKKFQIFIEENDPKALLNFIYIHKAKFMNFQPTFSMYQGVLWALSKAGMPERCLSVLEEMGDQRDINSWNFYILACGNNRDPERLRQTILHLENENAVFNEQTYANIVLSYMKCAEFDRAITWFHKFKTSFASKNDIPLLPFSVFFEIIQFCIKSKRHKEINEMYSEISLYPNISPSIWFDLLNFFLEADQIEYVISCYKNLPTVTGDSCDVYFDFGLINKLLEISGRAGDPNFASEILFRMNKNLIPISLHHCACLIQSFSSRQDYISLMTLLPKIRALGWNPHEAMQFAIQPFPSVSLWTTAQRWLFSQSEVDSAAMTLMILGAHHLELDLKGIELYEACLSYFHILPEIHTYHAAILCAKKKQTRISDILESMRKHNTSPNTTTYNLIFTVADFPVAWDIFQTVKSEKLITSESYLLLLKKYFEQIHPPLDLLRNLLEGCNRYSVILPSDIMMKIRTLDSTLFEEFYQGYNSKTSLPNSSTQMQYSSPNDVLHFFSYNRHHIHNQA